MKLLLVQPPIRDFYDTEIRLQPIGLAYIKAYINQQLPQVDVIIRDYHHGWGRRTVAVPQPLKYLKQYYAHADLSPFSTFHQFYHFGLDFNAIEQDVVAIAPDMVGISALFTPYYLEALEVAKRVKSHLNIPVVFGGSHVSAVPESVLANPSVDFIIRGEGETPMVALLRALMEHTSLQQVPNLGYKNDGIRILNPIGARPDINRLPIPDLSGLSKEYCLGNKPLAFLITSRSCPHKCSFCSVHTTFGKVLRRRQVDHVLAEIEQRVDEGFSIIDFEDDNLTYYKDEFKALCRKLIERFPNQPIEFVAMNGISYLSLDNEMLELMHRAGFRQLNLALVSSDTSVRKTTKRPHTVEAYTSIVKKSTQLGFKIVSYQILGLPNETLESMIQTLVFNARLPVLLGASPFYLLPDTPIAGDKVFNEQDFITARLTAFAIETPNFCRDDLYTLFILTRIINFLKGLDIPNNQTLSELLNHTWSDQRTRVGCILLQRLMHDGQLFYWTRRGLIVNTRFVSQLFHKVIPQIQEIKCQNGRSIFTKECDRTIVGGFPTSNIKNKSPLRSPGFLGNITLL